MKTVRSTRAAEPLHLGTTDCDRSEHRVADLPTIELTKIDVAEAHIRTAVRLFFEGCHPVPVYTLANAAREILTSIGEKTGIEVVTYSLAQRKGVTHKSLVRDVKRDANYFKHADRDARMFLDSTREKFKECCRSPVTTSDVSQAECRSKLKYTRFG